MISVIVPARDAERTLGECLRALLHQQGLVFGEDYEVIVVDDGSIDGTSQVAEQFPIVYIQQPNAGPGSARNAGAKIAKGELLAFTDADCAPSPAWLIEITKPFENAEVVGVKGTYLTNQREWVARFVQLEYEYKYGRMLKQSRIDFIDTYSAAYRKDVFMQNDGFNESFRILEDQELSSRLARKGYHLVFEPRAVVYHYHNRTFSEYLRKKFRIGYWKAYTLRSIPEKAFSDSHTAPTQRLEILLFALLLLNIPLIGFWPREALIVFLITLCIFVLTISPFLAFILKRDVRIGTIAPLILLGRAGALGSGLLKGLVKPPRKEFRGYPQQTLGLRVVKRLLDILGGGIGLLLSAPLLACAAIAIRMDSSGPIIFKQSRAGEYGRPFTIYKLRTMVDGADQMATNVQSMSQLKGPAFKIANDPRVTRVGRYLRRWSLDELPQFWNVLKGDMSLVGPRPEVMRIVESYSDEQRERLMVRPGLTGPVQVNGRGGLDFDQRFKLELDYLRNYSLLEDVKIILKTFSAILSGEGMG
jgi:lipopolysaccharide/colanic/teichoic acid biosynthesis glycosyltransferase/glycosyltransferase involved in cell wall biosynthesis